MSEFSEIQAIKITEHHEHGTLTFLKEKNLYNKEEKEKILNDFILKISCSLDVTFKDKTCCFDDNFLSRFLYFCKFNCENAIVLLKNYLEYKQRYRNILKKINIFDERIQKAVRSGNPTVLKERDRKGRKIITFTASNWDIREYNLTDIYRSLLMTLDLLLENVQNQALGFVVIVDWSGFTYMQSKCLTPTELRLIIKGLQNAMPVNFKEIHFLSQPWYVETIFSLIKPMLKENTRKRLIFHGANLTSLHNYVNKSLLPAEFGGAGPSINTLDWYHYIIESSQNPVSIQPYKIVEPPIYNKIPQKYTAINFKL